MLDHNRTLLFRHFERRYLYLLPVTPAAEECLLVPFHVHGKAVGTIWAIMHNDRRKFDAEDDRVMDSLGKRSQLDRLYQRVLDDHPRLLALKHALVRFAHIAAGSTFTTAELHPYVADALACASFVEFRKSNKESRSEQNVFQFLGILCCGFRA